MGKHSTASIPFQKRWPLMILLLYSLSTAIVFFIRGHYEDDADNQIRVADQVANPLSFMKSKLVLLVSRELSLSGGPLLLMELAFLLRGVGAKVVWISYQKPTALDEVVYSLEHKMLDRGDMIDSHTTAEYWRNRTQARGECFGRATIETMAFQLPVLGTAAGGTMEIVVNGMTGWLHSAGKEGVTPLAENIVKLATHVEQKLTMGKKGYESVKEMFLEPHMSHRIASVLKEVLRKSNSNT